MADWIHACACEEINEEDVIGWDYDGRTFAIYNTADGFYCTDGMCTHESTHLEMGLVMGHVIECPLHQGRFDIKTGKALDATSLHRSKHLSSKNGKWKGLRQNLTPLASRSLGIFY